MTFEEKKKNNLIFTMHNLNPKAPYISVKPSEGATVEIVHPAEGLPWWDREKHRYRTAEEQREYELYVIEHNKAALLRMEEESRKLVEQAKREERKRGL